MFMYGVTISRGYLLCEEAEEQPEGIYVGGGTGEMIVVASDGDEVGMKAFFDRSSAKEVLMDQKKYFAVKREDIFFFRNKVI